MLNHLCIPGINSTWSQALLIYILILFASILLQIFASVLIRDIRAIFYIIYSVFDFGIRVMRHKMTKEVLPPFQVFWKSLRRIVLNSLNVWQNSPVKLSGSGLFFVRRFLTDDPTFLLIYKREENFLTLLGALTGSEN